MQTDIFRGLGYTAAASSLQFYRWFRAEDKCNIFLPQFSLIWDYAHHVNGAFLKHNICNKIVELRESFHMGYHWLQHHRRANLWT
jgi:hypothetical protein